MCGYSGNHSKKDGYFATKTTKLEGLSIPGYDGQVEFGCTMVPNRDVINIDKLPKKVTLSIVNTVSKDIIASVDVTVPIEAFILGLRDRYKDQLKMFLFGQMGTGKSSFVNTVSTVFNLHPDFRNFVNIVTGAGTHLQSFTRTLRSFEMGGIKLFDGWGWEGNSDEENTFKSYPEDFFRNLLLGNVPEGIDLDNLGEFSIDDIVNNPSNKIDIVVLFLTHNLAENDKYVSAIKKFQGVANALAIKTMVLLTQIDVYDTTLEKDPYSDQEKLHDIISKVSIRTGIPLVDIKPVVNYVNTAQRTWELDRACFVPIFHAFLLASSEKKDPQE